MKKGFTLLEIIITIAIIVVLTAVATLSLFGNKAKKNLDSATQEIAALLREAQSDAMAQKQGASWGVHLDNTTSTAAFYSFFYTSNGTYNSSQEVGHYLLPTGVCYATSSVASGSSTNIIFSGVTGAPSASATITLQLMGTGGCGSATSSSGGGVSRAGSGKIFFDDFNRANL